MKYISTSSQIDLFECMSEALFYISYLWVKGSELKYCTVYLNTAMPNEVFFDTVMPNEVERSL